MKPNLCRRRSPRPRAWYWYVLFCSTVVVPVAAQEPTEPRQPLVAIELDQVDRDFAYQGEFEGEWWGDDKREKSGVQVIALGKGRFQAIRYAGGLPGAGFDGEGRHPVQGEGEFELAEEGERGQNREGGVRFRGGPEGEGWLTKEGLKLFNPAGEVVGEYKRVVRRSKTLGEEPPEGAIVLFDGSNGEQWNPPRVSEQGLLLPGTTSRERFGDHRLHLEFRLPYQPEARGQGRGNSGVYLQGRWEVQMLDSFGLTGEQNECGGLYSIAKPIVNMCLPPLTWQTYDIEFTAERYKDGEVTAPARITVYHNGVLIHDNVELPHRRSTAAPQDVGDSPGPVYLQDHGNPVRYRNIWVVTPAG